MSPKPRKNIAALGAYPMAKPVAKSAVETAYLANNELWAGPSEKVLQAISQQAKKANLYHEPSALELREAIARQHDINVRQIVCSNGSCDLITLLCQVFCEPGDEVVVGPFSYMFFRTASQVSGATICMPPHSLELKLDDLFEQVTNKTRIVFLDNPQNPIGGVFSNKEIRQFHKKLPEDVLLVLDSAYAEFAEIEDYDAGGALVDEFENVVMLRTFSKIYGLADLRVGWSYSPQAIADLLNSVRQPSNMSGISIQAAKVAITEEDLVQERLAQNRAWRTRLISGLQNIRGLYCYPSHTNFVLTRLSLDSGFNANALADELNKQSIQVRSMAGYGLPDHIRISINPEDKVNRLIKALTQLLGSCD